MQDDIDRVLIDRAAIADRVKALADEITGDLCAAAGDATGDATGGAAGETGDGSNGKAPSGEPVELTLIPILTGSFIFAADLIRHLPLLLQIRLLSVSSYPGASTSPRQARVRDEMTHLPASLEGRHVLLLDDILDSGQTLQVAIDLLRGRHPASLHTCVLLRKRRPQAMAVGVDYVAFDIPDEFVVGYGLDFNDYYRNLPDIVTLKAEVVRRGQQAEQQVSSR